ncbi:beta-1,3-galactosyltransferase 1-like [Lineus longissimus]|uniref:beta-1,3-galactosyltransferase 1-like n=1 Tax=Lineus longissimus TaxID=88925 RepID=UPI00315D30A5
MGDCSKYTMKNHPDSTINCCGDDEEPKYCTVVMQCQKPRSKCGSRKWKIVIGAACVAMAWAIICGFYIYAKTEIHVGSSIEEARDDILYKKGVKHVKPLRCKNCFQFNPQLLINNPGACGLEDGHPTLLILVGSRPENKAQRDAIRNTWGGQKINGTTIKTVFLFGLTDSEKTKNLILENSLHHDIIQGSFYDSYRNLTYKSVMGLKWAAENCGKAQYIMKADDDTFIRIGWLMQFLNRLDPKKRFVTGNCFTSRPIRNKTSKWYTKESEYNEQFYPMYCSGQGYIMSQSALQDIVQITPHVPFLYLEDVYISGMCRNALNISYIHNEQIGLESRFINDCDYLSWVIMSHYVDHTEIIRLTRLTTDDNYIGTCISQQVPVTKTTLIVISLSLTICIMVIFCYRSYLKRLRGREFNIVPRLKYSKLRRRSRHSFGQDSQWTSKTHRL